MTLPSTTERIPQNTDDSVNRRIRRETEERIRSLAPDPAAINRRLAELDHEWDIERTLMANASALALTGTLLAATVNKRFLFLPGVVTGFLLQHALQGWCPPMPLFRRAGIRTAKEIESERAALKALRGDFKDVTASDAEKALEAADI